MKELLKMLPDIGNEIDKKEEITNRLGELLYIDVGNKTTFQKETMN